MVANKKIDPQIIKDMKPIQKMAINFINEHWDEIDKKKTEIFVSKEKFIKEIKSNLHTAAWVITEVMSWGCEKDYIRPQLIESNDEEAGWIIKVGRSYYRSIPTQELFKKVKPKVKKILVFE